NTNAISRQTKSTIFFMSASLLVGSIRVLYTVARRVLPVERLPVSFPGSQGAAPCLLRNALRNYLVAVQKWWVEGRRPKLQAQMPEQERLPGDATRCSAALHTRLELH